MAKNRPIPQLNDFQNANILVIGDIMLDCYLWGKVERISPEAPVPIVHAQKKTYMLGGAGNVALNLSSLGCNCNIIALCGMDSAGSRVEKMLEENRISCHLLNDENRMTITKTRIMAIKQQLLRIDEEKKHVLSENEKESLLTRIKKTLPQYHSVILSDYGKGLLQTQGFTESVISLCRSQKIPVLVDPKGRDWERYNNATCVTPNSAELNLVAGEMESGDNSENPLEEEKLLVEISRKIRERYGLEWLLVTRGPKGMCLTGKDEKPFIVATQARQVYDVSGAGDTVISVLAAGLSIGLSFEDAALLANKAAGIVVGKVGTQPVTKDELELAINTNN
ncbi:Bifunctional protein hldE (Includes: D-beta-D-heptose 7-phosphate kinase; D-beta-D-heptose 1-phosphate adenosyltransferase) (fragment) [Desulfamplus magnetovallimortis]|uniref:Bifunctional protein hldE n=1 Tax=Desulfamplus magnetovallimortis TaxID=1246637 RepID=A0A1W1H800_9BACT